MSISVKNLTKTYGQQKALDNISFELQKGEIVGFLGPNGAGKSTTMKIATCYLPPTSGSLQVCGLDVTEHPLEVKRQVGYLPEHNPLYLEMYVHEYLGFIGHVHGLRGRNLRAGIRLVVDLFGLTREQNKKIGALSKGYRQRVGLAQALIHDPKVLILDEPTTGLDPNQIVEIRNLISEVSRSKTVLFSTHIMQEVQALCKRVVIIDNGVIVADKNVDQLQRVKDPGSWGPTLKIAFKDRVSVEELQKIRGDVQVTEGPDGGLLMRTPEGQDLRAEIFHFAVKQGWTLIELQVVSDSLEQIFQDLTGKRGKNG